MKLLRIMLVVFAIGFSTMCNAKNFGTLGDISCGKWVKDRAEHQPSWPAIVDMQWLHGLLVGIAFGMQLDLLKQVDPDSISLWMDNYCQKNPLDMVSFGGQILAAELIKRMP